MKHESRQANFFATKCHYDKSCFEQMSLKPGLSSTHECTFGSQ